MHLTKDDVLAKLTEAGIAYSVIDHPPVHTVEEALPYWSKLDCMHTKNLFFKDAKDALWLVSAPTDRAIDLKLLPKQIGSKRLSFAREEILFETLGVRQGAVSPLALINAPSGKVNLVLDVALTQSPQVGFHPLDNTATIALASSDLLAFLQSLGHAPAIVALDQPPSETA